jgi:DNA repair protein RadC
MGEETLGYGAGGEILFSPRQIVETAFRYGAASLVMVHNHPGGNPDPSREDRTFTRELLFALKMVDIQLRDHLIIGDDETFSFRERGLIDRFNSEFIRFQKETFGSR